MSQQTDEPATRDGSGSGSGGDGFGGNAVGGDAFGDLRGQAADGLRALAGELREMADGSSRRGPASAVAAQAAARLDTAADRLRRDGFDGLLDEVRGLARRHPGTFLAGVAVAGVLAGRLTRGPRQAGHAPAVHTGPPPPPGWPGVPAQRPGPPPYPYPSPYPSGGPPPWGVPHGPDGMPMAPGRMPPPAAPGQGAHPAPPRTGPGQAVRPQAATPQAGPPQPVPQQVVAPPPVVQQPVAPQPVPQQAVPQQAAPPPENAPQAGPGQAAAAPAGWRAPAPWPDADGDGSPDGPRHAAPAPGGSTTVGEYVQEMERGTARNEPGGPGHAPAGGA